MEQDGTAALGESAAACSVKSPSYSPQLADEVDSKAEAIVTAPLHADVPSSEAFRTLLSSLPLSSTGVQAAYDNLLSLYLYTVNRLQLLKLIGANGVLTDALITRLQQLNEENDRLLESERANRDGLRDLKLQLNEQQKRQEESEAALNDAHQMLKQQEEELAGQTKLLEELKGKLASERASHSRHTSSRSQEHQSHRSSRDDGRRHADREKEYSRHRSEPREHQSESRKHEDRDQHRPRERESSVTSSRHSSNRREGDRSRREREREHSRTGRIQEEPEMRHDSHHEEINEAPQQAAEASPIAERSISINGAASKHASGQAPALPSADKLARLPHQESKNVALADEDNEIDLGEDLLLEEEEAPPVKPAPAPARKERPRSRERHRSHDANHRTRSRSPTRTRREEDEVSRRHEQDDRQVQPSGMKSPSREARRDGSPARQSSTEDKAIRDRKRDSAASRNRSNMFGRLGLPLSADGGRSGLSIRGAGRNSKT